MLVNSLLCYLQSGILSKGSIGCQIESFQARWNFLKYHQ